MKTIDIDTLKINLIKLAIRGILTSDLSFSTSGLEAINEAKKDKEEAILRKEIRKEKSCSDFLDDEIPFTIPKNWAWTRLSSICSIESGGTPDRSVAKYWNGSIPWLKIGDINGKYVKYSSEFITQEGLDNSSAKLFKKGTILYTIFATIGNVGILDFESTTNQAICGITFYGNLNTNYLYYVLTGLKDILVGKSHGMTQANINQSILKNVLVPIPPVEEQQIISNKLDDIFSLLDDIDQKQKKLLSIKEKLKNEILKQAIQGKLVKQFPESENVDDTLKQIYEEQALSNTKRKAKDKNSIPIDDSEIPFKIPSNWKWVRLSTICKRIFAGGDKPKDFVESKDDEHQIPVVANGTKNDGILGYTSSATAYKNSITVAGRGTIGFSLYRTYDYCPIVRLIVIEQSKYINPRYLLYVLNVLLETGMGTSIPQLTVPMLSPKLIPLPPFEEQNRIVIKAEEMLDACSKLL